MSASAELPHLELSDGTSVRFLLGEATGPTDETDEAEIDLPEGMGTAVPVSRGGQAVATFATSALRQSLRPLGPLLEEVHTAMTGTATPPTEITLTFGIQVGSDLKLGVVSGSGQAHLSVTATWSPAPSAD